MTTSAQRSATEYARPADGRHALVITLDHVEPAFYTGWPGELVAADQDRAEMMGLLRTAEFADPIAITNERATRDDVIAWLNAFSDAAISEDHVVVYFSGHGATLPDLNHDELGALRDGAWCLYDGMFVDDELTAALQKFGDKVRVVLISDSCYTGTIVAETLLEAQRKRRTPVIDQRGSKLAPADIGERVYEAQRDFYDPLLTQPPIDPDTLNATWLILSACDRDELARIDDEKRSIFTRALVDVWDEGNFTGTYAELFAAVRDKVRAAVNNQQNPQTRLTGKRTDPTLENQTAFGGKRGDGQRDDLGGPGPGPAYVSPIPMAAKGFGEGAAYGESSRT